MATSGTVATTVIDTSAVIEHAFRRCKVPAAQQTPETVLIAKENLYMLLLNLGNRGLNLWAVERKLVGLNQGQLTYTTPAGTLDVLNVIYTQPTLVSSTFSTTANGGKAAFSTAYAARVGVRFSASYTGVLTISTSSDGVVYTTQATVASATYATGETYWFDVPTVNDAAYVLVEGATAPVSNVLVASALYDLPLSQWNRDTYLSINNKTQQSRSSTNYFFEKKLTPTITLWPVPNNSNDHLTLMVHRQPQDVGSLTQQLELPQRWLDGFIWLLAARLCFELPKEVVAMDVAQMVVQMADKQVFEAEQAESDGAPIYLTPGIGVYTR